MKKIFISMIAVILVITSTSVVNAATANERLKDYLKSGVVVGGETYSMSAAQQVQLDRFLSSNTLTDAEVNTAIAKANESVNLLKKYDLSKPSTIPASVKTNAIALVKEAGNAIGVDIKVDTNSNNVVVTDATGNILASGSFTDTKLPFTGTNVMTYAIIGSILAVSIAMVYSLKKELTNCED